MSLHCNVGTPRIQALRALTSHLYTKDGQLRFMLQRIVDGEITGTVALVSNDEGHHFGTCVIAHNGAIMVYVVPELRGKGWGSKLVTMAKCCAVVPVEEIFAYPGDNFIDSIAFWRKNRIACRDFCQGVLLTDEEKQELSETKRTLVVRKAEEMDDSVLQALYVGQLYSDLYSEEQDGIRGQLSYWISERIPTVEYILFHIDGKFSSCATISKKTSEMFEDGTRNVTVLNIFVHEEHRKKGFAQQIINKAKALYPDRALFGYHTDTSSRLYERNGVLDLRSPL